MRKSFVLFIVSLLLVGSLFPGQARAEAKQEQAVKILVPNFTLTSASGEEICLSDYRGQTVVLNFWATWCFFCLSEMNELQKLHEEFLESEEAVLLLLNQIDGRRETEACGTEYLAKNNFTMLNLFDWGTVGYGIFGIPGLPTTVVIDKEGYLAGHVVGATTADAIKKIIEEAR